MINILIRADSSSDIGTGHIMRDLVLAKRFKDANVRFATQDLKGNINHKIKEQDYPLSILPSMDIDELIILIHRFKIDMIVIDHYKINYDYEKTLKEKTGIKIFVLDDTYQKHCCDILLNHNIYAKKQKYKGLVPEYCDIKCGEAYTLIREEFIQINRKHRNKLKSNFTVFVVIGGSDHLDLNAKIIALLRRFDLSIHLITTSSNMHLKKLKNSIKRLANVKLHIDINNISDIINQSDFGIISASVISQEVIYLQKPFIAIQTIKNQEYLFSHLKQKHFLVIKHTQISQLSVKVEKLMHRYAYYLNKVKKINIHLGEHL